MIWYPIPSLYGTIFYSNAIYFFNQTIGSKDLVRKFLPIFTGVEKIISTICKHNFYYTVRDINLNIDPLASTENEMPCSLFNFAKHTGRNHDQNFCIRLTECKSWKKEKKTNIDFFLYFESKSTLPKVLKKENYAHSCVQLYSYLLHVQKNYKVLIFVQPPPPKNNILSIYGGDGWLTYIQTKWTINNSKNISSLI